MRKLLIALASIITTSAFAQTMGLPPMIPPTPQIPAPLGFTASFSHGVPLSEFTRLVLNDVFQVPFVLSPELLSSTDVVGVAGIRNMPKDKALGLLKDILSSRGFVLTQAGSVYTVTKLVSKEVEQKEKVDVEAREYFVYYPKHRLAQVFYKQLPGLFPRTYFSFTKRANSPFSPDTEKSQVSAPDVPDADKDEPLDSFFAFVPKSQLPDLKRVLEAIDTPYQQLRICAALYEVQVGADIASGVSLAGSVLNGRLGVSLGHSAGPDQLALKVGSFTAAISALNAESRFSTRSVTCGAAISGKTANLLSGEKVPVLGATTTQNGTTTQSVTYQEVGNVLKVKPTSRAETILVDVTLDVSAALKTDTGVNASPTISTRTVTTSAVAAPGTVLLLGGMDASKSSTANSRFFGFSTGKALANARTELVLLLSVERVNADSDAVVASARSETAVQSAR